MTPVAQSVTAERDLGRSCAAVADDIGLPEMPDGLVFCGHWANLDPDAGRIEGYSLRRPRAVVQAALPL